MEKSIFIPYNQKLIKETNKSLEKSTFIPNNPSKASTTSNSGCGTYHQPNYTESNFIFIKK